MVEYRGPDPMLTASPSRETFQGSEQIGDIIMVEIKVSSTIRCATTL